MKTGMDVQVGDEIFVRPANYSRTSVDWVPARVVKAARVWLEISAGVNLRTWRMRRDTQNEGRDSYYQARFVTPEQREAEEEIDAADAFLRSQRISLERNSPWFSQSRRIALATAVKILGDALDGAAEAEAAR